MNQKSFQALLSSTTANGSARQAALGSIAAMQTEATDLMAYESEGRVLVIGPLGYAREQAESLPGTLDITLLAPQSDRIPAPATGVRLKFGDVASLTGHLGNFNAQCTASNRSFELGADVYGTDGRFDIVLDLSRPPLIRHELTPPGYFAPNRDQAALYRAITEIPELVGRFEKPRYLTYDPSICAHGERGVTGCTRCLDVCPSGSLTSLRQRIEVDFGLCHGVGACAASCPTGAIGYAYPSRLDLLSAIRSLLGTYRERAGSDAVLLLHTADTPPSSISELEPARSESILPVEIEDVGMVGIDLCLVAAAYGAVRIALLTSDHTPAATSAHLERHTSYVNLILRALGYEWVSAKTVTNEVGAMRDLTTMQPNPPHWKPATFSVFEDKRSMQNLAIEHLYEQAPQPGETVELPDGAPFGEILVDTEKCTLCMACTSVCPTNALQAGTEHPRLSFVETDCVQCSICRSACPENAISLHPRLAFSPELRKGVRVLYEDEPFLCISCAKPFATRSVIAKMTEKLRSHRMFQGEAIRRLEMCEDCRVKSLFSGETTGA